VPTSRLISTTSPLSGGGDLSADRTISVQASATSRVLGRKTSGAGVMEEVTASEVLDFITSTQGSLLHRGAGGWGAPAGVTVDALGNLVLTGAVPSAPSAGQVCIYASNFARRSVPAFRSPNGSAVEVQPHIGITRRMEWIPHVGTNTITTVGGVAPSITSAGGTATLRSIASGSFYSWTRRVSYVSAAAAGSSSGLRGTQLAYGLGDVAGAGGFTMVFRFGIEDASAVANARMFVGLIGQATVIGNVEPSSLANIIGVGCDAGFNNLYVMHNDASGTATTISLGSGYPTNTRSTDVFELVLYARPNATEVGYRVTRLNTGDSTSGTLSTDLPANTLRMAPQFWRNNGSTAVAVDIAMMGMYAETEN
jgi:hypothetical protein